MHNPKLALHLGVLLSVILQVTAAPAAMVTWKDAISGNWTDATKWSSAQVPGASDDVVIDKDGSFTVTLNAVASIASFTLGRTTGTSLQTLNIVSGGTLSPSSASVVNGKGILQLTAGSLSGSGSVTVDGLLKWTGGTMTGGGAVNISLSGVLNFGPGGDVTLDGKALTIAGAATSFLPAFSDIFLRNNAVITNNGTFDIHGDNAIDLGDASSPQLINAGVLRKSTSANSAIIDVHFVNTGTVEATSGTLELRRSSLFAGTVVGSTTILLPSGTHTFDGLTIAGAGGIRMTGGTTTTAGAGAMVGPAGRLRVAGGTLAGAGPLNVDGVLDWTGGTITGSGPLNIKASGVLNIGPGGDVTLDGRTLTNAGIATSVLPAFSDIFMRNNAVIANNGTFDIQGDNAIDLADASSPQLTNAGILKKSTSANAAIIDVHFVNTGTVEASSGTLELRRSSLFAGTVTGSTLLLFPSGTHTFNGLTIAGVGGARMTGGSITTTGAGATVSPSGRLRIAGGTLAGSGPLSVDGILDWTSGTVTGSGAFNITANGVLNFGPGGDLNLDGRTIANSGTATSVLTAFNDIFLRNNA